MLCGGGDVPFEDRLTFLAVCVPFVASIGISETITPLYTRSILFNVGDEKNHTKSESHSAIKVKKFCVNFSY